MVHDGICNLISLVQIWECTWCTFVCWQCLDLPDASSGELLVLVHGWILPSDCDGNKNGADPWPSKLPVFFFMHSRYGMSKNSGRLFSIPWYSIYIYILIQEFALYLGPPELVRLCNCLKKKHLRFSRIFNWGDCFRLVLGLRRLCRNDASKFRSLRPSPVQTTFEHAVTTIPITQTLAFCSTLNHCGLLVEFLLALVVLLTQRQRRLEPPRGALDQKKCMASAACSRWSQQTYCWHCWSMSPLVSFAKPLPSKLPSAKAARKANKVVAASRLHLFICS